MDNENLLSGNRSFHHVNQRVQGIREPFQITVSGLMAAAHRQGHEAVREYLEDLAAQNWNSQAALEARKARIRDVKERNRKAAIYTSIETRLREFANVPYRLDDYE